MAECFQALKNFLKCFFGIHCVPKNWAFEDMGSIFAGGVCPRCGGVTGGKFICDTWTGKEFKSDGTIMLTGYDISAATRQGYKILGNIDDLWYEWQEAHGKVKKAIAR